MPNSFLTKNILKIILPLLVSGYLTACSDSGSENTQTGTTTATATLSNAPASLTTNAATTASTVVSSTTSTAIASTTSTSSTPVTSSSSTISTPSSNTILATSSSTNSGTKNILIASSGKILDTGTLTNPNQSVAIGSSGNESDPALEGADMTPLTSAEIAAMKITTSVASIQESILGFDSRYRANPYSYPERAVASITYNGLTHCTGWFISPDTLVTAGHCVHGGGSNGRWGTASSFKVYPGLDNGSYAFFGSCTTKEIYSSAGWVTAADPNSDVGILKLNCTLGNVTGYFSYFVADNNLAGKTITINGYPGDKNDGSQQWASQGTISSVSTSRLYYDNDTTGGMSGSPIWTYGTNQSAWVLGIHTTGESTLQVGTNSGVRLTQTIFDLITAVKNLP